MVLYQKCQLHVEMVEKFGKLVGGSQNSPVGKTEECIGFMAITPQSFSCQGNVNPLVAFMN